MRKLIILFTISLLLFPLGCTKQDEPKPNKPVPQNQSEPKNQVDQEKQKYYIGAKAPVAGLNDWIKKYSLYEGVFQQKKGNYQVILLSQGERLTGGYEVKVDQVIEEKDKWVIEATIIEPAEEDYSTQVIDYPYEVVAIANDNKPIEVRSKNDNKTLEVTKIPEGKDLGISKSFIVTQPLPGQEATSPLTIKGKARVFEASFRVHIEDGHQYLAEKIVMADEGAPAWGDFELTLPFDKPANQSLILIFSVENMENGKLIQELQIPLEFK